MEIRNIKIVIIGAGNVGTHLAKGFFDRGFEIVQIFSRQKKKAKSLAKLVNADFTTRLESISKKGDLYILAVSDGAIHEVSKQLIFLENKLVCHTSGATSKKIFESYFKRFGVFYPLQTFSLSKKPDWKKIPFCIDANKKKDRKFLKSIAEQFSQKIYDIDDEKRAILHVAAVFVNNFSNYLFQVGETILEKEQISFEILKPLILETVLKLEKGKAKEMQTGPAIRGDKKTIKKHLKYLKKYPEYQDLYQKLTKSIQNNISTRIDTN